MNFINIEKNITVFNYWGQGYDNMPIMIKKIYNHNLKFCKKNNINLILIDDKNVYDYIIPHHRYNDLAYNFKSDIIRFYILDKYGGFWLDTDIIIIKDLTQIYTELINKDDYDMILDVEHQWNEGVDGIKLGSASIVLKKNSICSNYCVNYINNILNNNQQLDWNDIGPWTSLNVYLNFKERIYINNYEITSHGCNFISWRDNPGINKDKWYFNNIQEAENKANDLKNNKDCYYIITWSIYKENNITYDICDFIFNDKRSVFSYFVDKINKIYIYNNFNFYNKYIENYLEEFTVIEKYYFDELINSNNYLKVESLENADLAFIPITPASHIYELGLESFRCHYNEFINYINLNSNKPHFIVYPYTFCNKFYNDLSFIDNRIYILSLENEITNFDYQLDMLNLNPKIERCYNTITIPYQIKNNNINISNDNLNDKVLFSYVGMQTNSDLMYIKFPNRINRLKKYRENILNEFIKKYGSKNIIIGSPDKNDPYTLYSKSKFSLILRGDTFTRKAFYQSLIAGSIPIIFNDCLLEYQNYNGFEFNIEDVVIKIPFCNELNSRDNFIFFNENNVWNIIDKYINNDILIREKLENIKKIIDYIDYNIYIDNIRAPIYHSINSIIKKHNLNKCFELVYFYIQNNFLIKKILNDNIFKNNNILDFESEYYNKFNNIFLKKYKTYNIDKADYILIPVFYLDINEFSSINIIKNKKYILLFDKIDDNYFHLILKYPKNSIIIFDNMFETEYLILNNTRLQYFGEHTHEHMYDNDNNIYMYDTVLDTKKCIELFNLNKNVKNIVYHKPNGLFYSFNNINFEICNNVNSIKNNFFSLVKYSDLLVHLNNNFQLYNIKDYKVNILKYLINNYL